MVQPASLRTKLELDQLALRARNDIEKHFDEHNRFKEAGPASDCKFVPQEPTV